MNHRPGLVPGRRVNVLAGEIFGFRREVPARQNVRLGHKGARLLGAMDVGRPDRTAHEAHDLQIERCDSEGGYIGESHAMPKAKPAREFSNARTDAQNPPVNVGEKRFRLFSRTRVKWFRL
jgi:hypothetical protein